MPQVSGAPSGLNKILETVYESALKKFKGNKAKASKIAWGAVKNAGWHKSGGKWTKTKEMSENSTIKEFAMVKVKDFPIFASGKYKQGEFNDNDLDGIVKSYNEKTFTAGGVQGHSSDHDTTAPNLAVIHGLQKIGNQLWTKGIELAEDLIDAIKNKSIRYPSVELYAPDDTSNPVPGSYYLANIGFLGAQAPAVKGLPMLASALGFAEVHKSVISIEQPDIKFSEIDWEAIEDQAIKDTIEQIKEAADEFVRTITEELVQNGQDMDDNPEYIAQTRSNCFNALYVCSDTINTKLCGHFDFQDKTNSLEQKDGMAEMAERIKGLANHYLSKGKKLFTHKQKESDMDEKTLKEFNDKVAAFELREKEFNTKQTELENAKKVETETALNASIEKKMKEFKEECITKKLPVAKLEAEGLFALGAQLLRTDAIEFGEKKEKKQPMEILRALVANVQPIQEKFEFGKDPNQLIDLAKKIGAVLPNNMRAQAMSEDGLLKVAFAEEYVDKHAAEIKGKTRENKLAFVMQEILLGKIKLPK